MTLRDAVLGNTQDSDVRLAAAIRAVDAALAACEAARLALLTVGNGTPPAAVDESSDGCPHPAADVVRVRTFGGLAEAFCKACGERIDC